MDSLRESSMCVLGIELRSLQLFLGTSTLPADLLYCPLKCFKKKKKKGELSYKVSRVIWYVSKSFISRLSNIWKQENNLVLLL